MEKINKKKARKLYYSGTTIHVLPCKVGLGSMWIKPVEINKNSNMGFDAIVNRFEYYNCNTELGRYSSYYVD